MLLFYFRNPKFFIFWLILSLCSTFVAIKINQLHTNLHIQENKLQSTQFASTLKSNIEQVINNNIQSVFSLISLIKLNPDIKQDLFSNYASDLINQNNPIQNIMISSPNLTNNLAYPLENNENLISQKYSEFIEGTHFSEKSHFLIKGPIELTNGEEGFICNIPIFLDDENSKLWAVVSIIVNSKSFYNQTKLDDSEKYQLSLISMDKTGKIKDVLYGKSDIDLKDPLLLNLNLPNGFWQLAVSPKNGWSDSPELVKTKLIIHISLILWITILFILLYIYQVIKTKEKRFSGIFKDSPIGIGLIDSKSKNIIEANNTLLNQLNFNINDLQEINFFDLTTSNNNEENANLNALKSGKNNESYQKNIQMQNGEDLPVLANNFYLKDINFDPIICTILQDISKEKLQETQINTTNKLLKSQLQIMEAINQLQSIALNDYSESFNVSKTLKIFKEVTKSQLCIIQLSTNNFQLDDNNIFSQESDQNNLFEIEEVKNLLNEIKQNKCFQTLTLEKPFTIDNIKHLLITPILEHNNLVSIIILGRKDSIYESQFIGWLEPLFSCFAQVIQGINYRIKSINLQKQLSIAKDNAEKSSNAKSEFLAIMSHEIRTPINGVMGMLNLLNKTQLNNEQKHKVDVALSSSQSLLTVTNDILDFSKIEANKIEIEKRSFEILEMLKDIKLWFTPIAQQKSLDLNFDTSNIQHPKVVGDINRVKQIITNLVSNAIKFTHSGKINISIDTKKTSKGVKFHFGIQDSGIGIEKAMTEQLFYPFAQTDASMGRKFAGTGLGLAICKKLCELMDGNIWVTSKINQGSCFQFYINLDEDITTQDKFELDSSIDIKKYKDQIRILLVEDNFVNQEVISMTLHELGLNSHVAENGQAAIEQLKKNKHYNLIFMDCQMPIKDGFKTTQEIREGISGNNYKDIKIIALTANAMKGDKEKCLDAGMNDYISKPIEEEELKRVLYEFIQSEIS